MAIFFLVLALVTFAVGLRVHVLAYHVDEDGLTFFVIGIFLMLGSIAIAAIPAIHAMSEI